ncbi:MAG: hypothetical protein ACUVQ8_02140 [Nitrososphaeria archaeon]
MISKRRFGKRRGLSRVLTEIIFILLASTTAIGAFSIYNSYSSNMTGTTKVIIEQADIITSQNKAYVLVKNVGTINIGNIIVTIAGYSNSSTVNLPPGKEQTLIFSTSGLIAGQQYTVVLTVLDAEGKGVYTTTYTTTAKP